MKKAIVFALAMVMVIGFAGLAMAGVSGSKHDLASGSARAGAPAYGGGTGTRQICVFCHHPHRGDSGVANVSPVLLWNINSFESTIYATYNSTATTNALGGFGNALDASVADESPSFMCMSCHDGTLATGSLVGLPADGTGPNMTSIDMTNASLGTTLNDDHPVNFTYPAAEPNIVAPTSGQVTGDVSGNSYPLFSSGTKMQCGTCHDVHLGGTDSQSDFVDFMRGDTTGSVICLDCHLNK